MTVSVAHRNRRLRSSPSSDLWWGSPLAGRRRKSALEGFCMSTSGRPSSDGVTGTGWYPCVGAPGSLVGRSCCISIGRHYDPRRRSSHRYEWCVSSGAICRRGRAGAGQPLPGPQYRCPRRAVLARSRPRALVVPRPGGRSFTQTATWTRPHCRQSASPAIHEWSRSKHWFSWRRGLSPDRRAARARRRLLGRGLHGCRPPRPAPPSRAGRDRCSDRSVERLSCRGCRPRPPGDWSPG